MTDSNRLKVIHPNLLSSQVHCLKCLDNSSKVTLPTCFYCFTHKRKGGPSFMISFTFVNDVIIHCYVLQGQLNSSAGLRFATKAEALNQLPPPTGYISQHVRVKLLHLDCNTEPTVSLLLLVELWDIYTSQTVRERTKIISLRLLASRISAIVHVSLHLQPLSEKL